MDDFSLESRWLNYAEANLGFPTVRASEIGLMLDLTAAGPGDSVLDFGCGDGAITLPLADAVGNGGRIFAMDASAGMLERLGLRCGDRPIGRFHLDGPELPVEDGSIDIITSLANFHHVPDKLRQFQEFARVLRPGGRLIIGDVADNTSVQRYFDGTVNTFSSTGHRHRFLDQVDTGMLCREAGLSMESWAVQSVPWTFPDADACGRFLKLIHDATCDATACLDHAKIDLGYHESAGRFLLFWKLFYFVAQKPAGTGR